MRTMTMRCLKDLARVVVLAGAALVAMGAEGGDCNAEEAADPACDVASDCQGVPAVDCVGAWQCVSSACIFQCEHTPLCDGVLCAADQVCDPGTGQCVDDVEPPSLCRADDECGPGHHCSTSDGECLADPACAGGGACAAVCSGTCVPDAEPPVGCYGDQDCAPGTRCNVSDGVCNPPPGCDDGVCPAVCYGECVDAGPQGCWEDSDCGFGEECLFADGFCGTPPECDDEGACDAVCAGRCSPRRGCGSAADCRSDEYCGCAPQDGPANPSDVCSLQCLPRGEPDPCETVLCESGYQCVAGDCVRQDAICYSNHDCQQGQACVIDHAHCSGGGPGHHSCHDSEGDEAPCDEDRVACGGVCEAIEPCASDADCDEGQICGCPALGHGMGACTPQCIDDPNSECVADWQCAPGFECTDGRCVRRHGACLSDFDCKSYEYCGCAPWEGAEGGAAPTVCEQVCQPMDYECSDDSQCDSGQCELVACSSDSACQPGEECDLPPAQCRGYCVPPQGQPCDADGQCPDGFHCGCDATWSHSDRDPSAPCLPVCLPDTPDPTQCRRNSDCHLDEHCAIEHCVEACPGCQPGQPCPPCTTECWGTCQPNVWPRECFEDRDCDADEVCGCTPNPACPNCDMCFLQCVPKDPEPSECSHSDQCGPGQLCDVVCPPCACDADGECPWCECFGTCVDQPDPGWPCTPDGECPAGMQCECMPDPTCPECDVCFMQCVPREPATCTSDAQCGDDERCEYGPCPFFAPCLPDEAGNCGGCSGVCVPRDEPAECMATGCSGQVCATEPVFTTCDDKPHYVCYQLAECGVNDAGECGWAPNDEFLECMHHAGAFDAP